MANVQIVYFDINTGTFPGLHHGLAFLIGGLKESGNTVRLSHLDCESAIDQAVESIETNRPDIVGLSFTTNQVKYARAFFAKLDDRQSSSAPVIVAGGVHATLLGEEMFKEFPRIQGVCVGEGEAPFTELCRSLDSGEDYSRTRSFIFQTPDGMVKNPVEPLKDIDDLPLPDYTEFDFKKIIANSGGRFDMMLGRGCPYKCYYCCNHVIQEKYPNKNDYVRFPSIPRALEIIRRNLEIFPEANKIFFSDDTFTLKKSWLSEFCAAYQKEIGLPFQCNARIETIDDRVLSALKQGGCWSIDFGIEAGNEWVRRYILNRKHSNDRIARAFEKVKGYGIHTFSYNILGMPLETPEMAMDTFRLNWRLRPDFGTCTFFFPYPGSMLYKICTDYNLLRDDIEDISGYVERPSLKETHFPHADIIRQKRMMDVFFMGRMVSSKLKLPRVLDDLFLRIIILFRNPILFLLNRSSDNRLIHGLVRGMRKFALRHMR